MKKDPILRTLSLVLVAWSLLASWLVAQRMPQDSWYIKKTVETGIFAGGIASDKDGNIYISDAKLGLIKKFSPTYELLQTWGGLGTGDGEFGTGVTFLPESTIRNWSHVGAGGLCFTADQELVVCDPANHRIQVFSRTGAFLRKFGSQGAGDGQFRAPVAAAVAADGKIHVADRDNHRIQVFSPSGIFLSKFGTPGGFDGQFSKPSGLAFLPNGEIAVADSGNRRIQIFSSSGRYLRKFNQSSQSIGASRDGLMFSIDSGLTSVIAPDGSWSKDCSNYSAVVMGFSGGGQTTVPSSLAGVISIAVGSGYMVALKSDRTVAAWGANIYGNVTIPAGLSDVVAITAGSNHTVALKGNGTVVAWGSNGTGQTKIPEGLREVSAIDAGIYHTVALKNDGTVTAWGGDDYGQRTIPENLSRVVAIAAGSYHTVALLNDGTLRAWGRNDEGQTTIPVGLTGVVAIAAGSHHTVALLGDGRVIAWGDNSLTKIPVGLSGVVAIAAGSSHTVALLSDGTLRAWGWSAGAIVPSGLNGVVAISAGSGQTVALKSEAGASSSGICELVNGNTLVVCESGKLLHYTRTFRTTLPDAPNSIPLPVVISSSQRPGTSLVDIDFRVDDADDATVEVAALAFRNGGNTIADVITIKTLVEGTANKFGAGVATGQVHRLTWDARADVSGDFEQVQIEILAKDGRGLCNLDYIQIPAEGSLPRLKISKTPLKDADFHAAWLWLLANGNADLNYSYGKLKLSSASYKNGLDAVYQYQWDPWWASEWGYTNQHPDGAPMSRLDMLPGFHGYTPDSQVARIQWTGFFNPRKTGLHTFDVNRDDSGWQGYYYGNRVSVTVDSVNKLSDADSGSFVVNAQEGRPIPIVISYSNDYSNYLQHFNLKIQPPDEPIRDLVVGDFVVEDPVVIDGSTTAAGRAFLLARMGLREATAEEILRAQEAGTPGVINQWTPPLQVGPGERPVKVNAYGFETGDTGTWVVPITP